MILNRRESTFRAMTWLGGVVIAMSGAATIASPKATMAQTADPVVADDPVLADGSLEAQATWDVPTPDQIAQAPAVVAETSPVDPSERQAVLESWPGDRSSGSPVDLMEVLDAIRRLHPVTGPIVDAVSEGRPLDADRLAVLDDGSLPAWAADQLRLAVGIGMVRRNLHDESLELLSRLDAPQVVDPATLLFFRGLAAHQLVQRDAWLADLNRLLEREDALPSRYRDLARLVVTDLEALEADSLDEIARLMRDIKRRQELFRSGKVVRQEEDDVVAKLEKLIEELEKQQQQQQMAASTLAPSSPAQDSMLKGGASPGDVDRKPQGSGEDWGDRPEMERDAALAELAKDLPAHYRDLIEEFYRKLAEEPAEADR